MAALVLQQIACEPRGVFDDVLRARGAEPHRVELDEGESLPDWRGFDAIVTMGGPMSATRDDVLPWLRDEKRLIGEAVRAGTPSRSSRTATRSTCPRAPSGSRARPRTSGRTRCAPRAESSPE